MKAYIICFVLTLFFAWLADQFKNEKKKIIPILFLCMACFIPCFIAGIRSLDIGKDVYGYFMVLYKGFLNGYSFGAMLDIANVEVGFAFVVYLTSIFHNVHFCLFVIELLVCIPIFIVAYKNKDKISITMTITIFLLTLYCLSFNLLRQSIAISLIIYSISLFNEEKYKKSFIILILASLFHMTSLVCLICFGVLYICDKKHNNRVFILSVSLFCLIIFTLFFDKILAILPFKYSAYFSSEYATSSFSFMSVIKKLFWISFGVLYISRITNKKSKKYANTMACVYFLLIDLILYFMTLKVSSAGRLGYYFIYIFNFNIIPYFKNIFKKKELFNFITVLILVFFWFNMTIINNSDGTYPYKSEIAPILSSVKR